MWKKGLFGLCLTSLLDTAQNTVSVVRGVQAVKYNPMIFGVLKVGKDGAVSIPAHSLTMIGL